MAQMNEDQYYKLTWNRLKPVKDIQEIISDLAVTEVRWKMRRESKYWAKRTEVDAIDFDSLKEAEKYWELKILEKAWKISKLKLQPKFLLQESFKYNWKTERAITYIADFSYEQDSQIVIEDVKGFKTDIYKLKRKLFLKKYWHIYKFIET